MIAASSALILWIVFGLVTSQKTKSSRAEVEKINFLIGFFEDISRASISWLSLRPFLKSISP